MWHCEFMNGSIGHRIAAYRRRRGLSQAALAGLVGRSESWLSQVERGLRSVERLPLLTNLAAVLHVPVEALTDKATSRPGQGSTPAGALEPVRRFFASHSGLLGVSTSTTLERSAVSVRIADAHRDYQAARYGDVLAYLPALLTDVEAVGRAGSSRRHHDWSAELASAYVLAAKLLTKIGVTDLALLSADRAASAAAATDLPHCRGAAAYQVTCALLRVGRLTDAEQLSVQMAVQLQRHVAPSPSTASVAGSLWLIAAIAASRRFDRPEANRRLDEAQRLADQLGYDGNHAWTAFGPSNVSIHRVSVAAQLGDAGDAVRAAARITEQRLPGGLAGRRVQVHLDLADAHLQRRNTADALLHLLTAERIAPQALRHNIAAQDLTRSLLRRTTPSTSAAIHDLAVRAGALV
jgi:transcriptional regulator with XRE-family HTH domain